jgi:ADP-ribose pyrophosphatase YjhB (NUDIX family)
MRVEGDAVERSVCLGCRQVHYENPKVLVWCFAYWKDRLLLCRRAIPPSQGLWNPPAGFVEMGESLEEAAAREMAEEVGLTLSPAAMLLYRVASIPHMNEVYIGFRAELTEVPVLVPGPEVLEARLWSEAEFPVQQFAFRELLEDVPEDFFRCLRHREFPIVAVTVRERSPAPGLHHRP